MREDDWPFSPADDPALMGINQIWTYHKPGDVGFGPAHQVRRNPGNGMDGPPGGNWECCGTAFAYADLIRAHLVNDPPGQPPDEFAQGICAGCGTESFLTGPPSQPLCSYCDELRILPPPPGPAKPAEPKRGLVHLATGWAGALSLVAAIAVPAWEFGAFGVSMIGAAIGAFAAFFLLGMALLSR